MSRVKCSNHCSRCGEHFASVGAFEAHRRGKFRPGPGERGRHCVAPEDAADRNGDDVFVAVSHRGICDVYGDVNVKRNVTIWALVGYYEREVGEDERPTREELSRGGPSAPRRRRRRSSRWGRTLNDVR